MWWTPPAWRSDPAVRLFRRTDCLVRPDLRGHGLHAVHGVHHPAAGPRVQGRALRHLRAAARAGRGRAGLRPQGTDQVLPGQRRRMSDTPSAPATEPEVQRHTPFEDLQALLIGTLFVSIGLAMFRHLGLMTGGTVGLAFLAHYASGLPFGPLLFVINLPFYWLAWQRLGPRFTVKTLAAVTLLSGLTEWLRHRLHHPVPPPRQPGRSEHRGAVAAGPVRMAGGRGATGARRHHPGGQLALDRCPPAGAVGAGRGGDELRVGGQPQARALRGLLRGTHQRKKPAMLT